LFFFIFLLFHFIHQIDEITVDEPRTPPASPPRPPPPSLAESFKTPPRSGRLVRTLSKSASKRLDIAPWIVPPERRLSRSAKKPSAEDEDWFGHDYDKKLKEKVAAWKADARGVQRRTLFEEEENATTLNLMNALLMDDKSDSDASSEEEETLNDSDEAPVVWTKIISHRKWDVVIRTGLAEKDVRKGMFVVFLVSSLFSSVILLCLRKVCC
jgi:hypothetical protein